ncbi:spore germination protein (amino acid permease) [Tumebacillus sp. BK434]|uniref:GerAB/ArcD/ProY family transporter n=1 Tax=Tumebacillus sp. BK434 TaxID=2512169 RepID=UPI0010457FD7|nr:GerAB/ArcD/ProY family transporter [Tumebacillus sp. BK434]TCP53405.1 spore germination protein (amino acid permease) [Tumebacillus sp. BK434]
MRMHRIGMREAASVGIIFVITKIFLPFQRSMLEIGGTAAWLIALIAIMFCPVTWWCIRGVIKNASEGASLITATEEILGPVLGSVVNLAYFSFFYAITFIVLREFAEILKSDILPRTPIQMIMLSLLIPIAVVAHSGIENIGRLCWLTIGLILVSVMVMIIGGLISHTEPNALSPFWGTGRSQVLKMGVVRSSLFSELLVLGFLVPRLRKRKEWERVVWPCMLISSLILFSTILAYLYIFPYPAGLRISFPLYEISRVIMFGRWVQRVESLFLVVWLTCAVIKLAIGLYCSASTLAQVLRMPAFHPLIFPLSILAYSLALLPESLMSAVEWDRDYLRIYGSLFSICLPLMTWLVSLVRRKRQLL